MYYDRTIFKEALTMHIENRPNAFTGISNRCFVNLLSACLYVFDIIVKLGLP